jgi:hypothetical protein
MAGSLGTAVKAGVAFVVRELRVSTPMLQLRWFADSRLPVGTAAIAIGPLCLVGLTFNLTNTSRLRRRKQSPGYEGGRC